MKKILQTLLLTAAITGFAAPRFTPVPIAEIEVRSVSGFLNSVSNFTSQAKPELAGQLIFATAALTMNPQFAALDLNSGMKFVLLTGAGKSAANQTGAYNPDLFFCFSTGIRSGMEPEGDSMPLFGMPFQMYRQTTGRVILYTENALFTPYLKQISDRCFPAGKSLQDQDFRIKIDLTAATKLPGVNDAVKNGLLASGSWDPAYDPILTEAGDKIADELKSLDIRIKFPTASELNISGNIGFLPTSNIAEWVKTKQSFKFEGFHSFQGANEYMTAGIPPHLSLKKQILSDMNKAGAPQYLQECVMRSNGAIFAAIAKETECSKITLGLESGAKNPLEKALDADKTVQSLPSGIWMVDFEENKTAVYLKVMDDKLIIVSGKIKEAKVLQIMNDTAPMPKEAELEGRLFTSCGKAQDGTMVKRSEIRTSASDLLFFVRVSASDFPKQPTVNNNNNRRKQQK